MANDKSDWRDIGGLVNGKWSVRGAIPDHAAEQWEAMKAAYAQYTALRNGFEQTMQETVGKSLPDTHELKFGYNFGKLSVAVSPKRERKAQPKAESESLGDWLAGRAASGRGC